MRVYGYPRSGNHFLMRTLWLAFFRNAMADYRELFGAHFSSEPGSPSDGAPPMPVPDSVLIVRDARAVTRSIWAMRAWFGLLGPGSFEEFLAQPYSHSFRERGPTLLWVNLTGEREEVLGTDDSFAGIPEKPSEHHRLYHDKLVPLCRLVIRYEELASAPDLVLSRVADEFHLPYCGAVAPKYKVGYGV
jgi:hypothetical protein